MLLRPALFALSTLLLFAQPDPWQASELLPPAALAATLRTPGVKPAILFVGFPVLYKSTRIPGSMMTGPGARPNGIELLRQAVAKLPKNKEIVIYCGCCPFSECPNVRPAFAFLKQMGYTKVKVLAIPTNLSTDWVSKGYPTEKAAGITGS